MSKFEKQITDFGLCNSKKKKKQLRNVYVCFRLTI